MWQMGGERARHSSSVGSVSLERAVAGGAAPLRQRGICLRLGKQELLEFGACRHSEVDAAVFAAVPVDYPQQPTPGNQGKGQVWGFHSHNISWVTEVRHSGTRLRTPDFCLRMYAMTSSSFFNGYLQR